MEHWLNKRAALSPNQIAIEMEDHSVTFLQLQQKSQQFARQLDNLKPNGHIAILSDNSIDMAVAFWGCTYLQTPVVFLNTRLSRSEWQQQCNDADVGLILTSSHYLEKAKHLNVSVESFLKVKKLTVNEVPLLDEIDAEKVCSMMFTSGTTGRAKAVQQTFHNHWSSAVASSLNLGLLPEDKWLVCLPLFHIGGLSILIKSVIYGMPVYLLEKFDADKVHQAIMKSAVTLISVVAVTCSRLLERLGSERYPDSFRCMLLGGGPAPKPLLEQAKAKQTPVVQTYGMTETCSQIATLNEKDALRKLGSAGKPLFTATLKIVDEKEECNPNQIGEILAKGPMVSPGYYQHKKQSNEWLRTGDLGYFDEEGFLYVVDRRSDLIISGGENIYPAEIEEVLLMMDGIVEAGVTAEEDKQWGQVPVAYIVKNDKQLTTDRIKDYCKDRLANFKVPKQIHFRDQLPRNATNKLQRHKLK
ncbi:o-succinylbenzoate--CoA ligase [Gracilibacillus kekensis]|uniref:2-succinylbenzoate--CoA ligase n=1 Tax=Gracilibacillus kekensis TaxID=1027249 RepID=A0A1M7MKV7_9BACI|nr:o-succinylbenzoate--CoA ligase [Gracilibacillus kekensis]SHM91579.1 2-succinylbenzoyl-CoA synthetase [Gracilibacillus kekensis]